jgi:hypothetical protein
MGSLCRGSVGKALQSDQYTKSNVNIFKNKPGAGFWILDAGFLTLVAKNLRVVKMFNTQYSMFNFH